MFHAIKNLHRPFSSFLGFSFFLLLLKKPSRGVRNVFVASRLVFAALRLASEVKAKTGYGLKLKFYH